jgi:hypothetical protein
MSQRQKTYKAQRVDEHTEQANFVDEVRLRYGNRDDFFPRLLFSVPNGAWLGGSNPWALMNKFKAEGFQSGTADMLYLVPRGEFNCLALEFKAVDKRNDKDAVTPEQAEFLEAVNAAGGNGQVVYGAQEALDVFEWYMGLPVVSRNV